MLEFEFINEEGGGLGPTLEYYALLGQEIRDPKNKLLRGAFGETLFPVPIDPRKIANEPKLIRKKSDYIFESEKDLNKIMSFYKLIGTVIARAILDERLIDLPLNSVFWDLVLERVGNFFFLVCEKILN
jgi:E3 ubiquitin-protein ligase TRIP12